MDWNKSWLGICLSSVLGMGYADYTGYAPGTCTDTAAVQNSGQQTPCSEQYTQNSIRTRHFRHFYRGGK